MVDLVTAFAPRDGFSDANFFRRMMNEIKDPVYVIAPFDSFRFHYVNLAACEHYGLSEDLLLKMAIPDWDPNFPTLKMCEDFWARVKREKKVILETRHRVQDGSIIPVEVTASCFEFKTKEYLVGFIQNIVTRKEIEEKIRSLAENLARSNESLQQFAYTASHDLQEPLRMVSSFIQLLEKNYKKHLDAKAMDYIRVAVDGVSRMKELINSLLDYSRVEYSLSIKKAVDCSALIEKTQADLKIALAESKAELTVDWLPTVVGDEVQIRQLMQNLISNAIKFRGAMPPRIHVTSEELTTEWVFSVRDNGIGIEPQAKDRVFAIFQKLHSREEYPGTGLGLAICKKIVERHGGRIWFESKVGEGTTFRFTLPKKN